MATRAARPDQDGEKKSTTIGAKWTAARDVTGKSVLLVPLRKRRSGGRDHRSGDRAEAHGSSGQSKRKGRCQLSQRHCQLLQGKQGCGRRVAKFREETRRSSRTYSQRFSRSGAASVKGSRRSFASVRSCLRVKGSGSLGPMNFCKCINRLIRADLLACFLDVCGVDVVCADIPNRQLEGKAPPRRATTWA
jgi:hypothetical protein